MNISSFTGVTLIETIPAVIETPIIVHLSLLLIIVIFFSVLLYYMTMLDGSVLRYIGACLLATFIVSHYPSVSSEPEKYIVTIDHLNFSSNVFFELYEIDTAIYIQEDFGAYIISAKE